jgi:uncharacterized protein YgfB (UPF0149 family)
LEQKRMELEELENIKKYAEEAERMKEERKKAQQEMMEYVIIPAIFLHHLELNKDKDNKLSINK